MPTGGLYVLDRQHDDPEAYAAWLDRARPVVTALLPSRRTAQGVPA